MVFTVAVCLGGLRAQAQWTVQSMDLKVGWNAVYLEVDASYEKIAHLPDGEIPSSIEQIWLWEPDDSAARFFRSPNQPYVSDGSPWVAWKSDGTQNDLEKLIGAHAYLVKCDAAVTWELKGRPMPPDVLWTSDGVNLLGFPTPPDASPSLTDFLEPEPFLRQKLKVYAYQGPVDPIPSQLWSLDDVEVVRGQAYWLNAPGVFSRFYGPYHLELQDHTGVHFGDSLGQYRIRLRNLTDAELTVTLSFLDSEDAPDVTDPSFDDAGNATVKPLPVTQLGSVMIRGEPVSETSLRHVGIPIGGEGADTHRVTLAPESEVGSVVEVVVGVDRTALATRDASASGGVFSGILRLEDGLGLTQIDLPVTAAETDTSGLWVGEAQVNRVQHLLNTYATDEDGAPRTVPVTDLDLQEVADVASIDDTDESTEEQARSRLILALVGDKLHFRVFDALGSQVVDIDEETLAAIPQPYPWIERPEGIRARVMRTDEEPPRWPSSTSELPGGEQRAIIDDTIEMLDETLGGDYEPEVPGSYIQTGSDQTMGTVARAFPLRLILHQAPGESARLLQQVFYQIDSRGVGLLSTDEEDLEQDRLDQARRISCAHLPWSGSTKSWLFDGPISISSGTAAITVGEPPVVSRYDAHENNPFLHTYHPDHDNLSLSDDPNNPGEVLRQPITRAGIESYSIERTITLSFDAPGSDFEALTRATDRVFGTYTETLSILGASTENEGVTLLLEGSAATEDERNEGKPTGGFELQRISAIDTLKTP